MLWALYAGAAALIETAADVLRKKMVPPPLITATFTFAVAAIFSGLGVLFFRPALPPPAFLVAIFAAGGLAAFSLTLYLSALRVSPLSLVIPYISLTTVFLLVTGGLIAGDALKIGGIAGVVILSLGIFLLQADGKSGVLSALSAIGKDRGVKRMIGAAFLFSLLAPVEKIAIGLGGLLTTIALESTIAATLCALILLIQGARPRSRTLLLTIPLGAIHLLIAFFVLSGFALAPTSYVLSVKRLWIPLSVAAGAIFFREREGLASRLAGAGLMTAGAAVIMIFG